VPADHETRAIAGVRLVAEVPVDHGMRAIAGAG